MTYVSAFSKALNSAYAAPIRAEVAKNLNPNSDTQYSRSVPPKQPSGSASKDIKDMQRQLNVTQSGTWDATTNTAFIKFLKDNGFDKQWLSNGRFKGNIKDAIRVVLSNSAGKQSNPNASITDELGIDDSEV